MFDEDEGRSKEKHNEFSLLGLKKNHWIMIGITILIISLTSGLGLYFGLNRNEDKEGDNHYEEIFFWTFNSVLETTTNATSSGKGVILMISISKLIQ